MSDKKIGRLFIARKAGQAIMVGESKITVYFTKGMNDQITIMVEAPVEIPVSRVNEVDIAPKSSSNMSMTRP